MLQQVKAPVWTTVIAKWLMLEQGYLSANLQTKQKLRLMKRPEAITWWNGRVRKLPSLDDFGHCWWDWWLEINLEWRIKGANGRLLMEGSGSWDDMIVPGPNGLLSPLACLVWWYLSGVNMELNADWLAAVAEVDWVLQKLLFRDRIA
ncbi:hypothetical protein C8J56DRAFT_788108 [Mycena floridula]|nr:hypothetical protein C8J56DRAFT_788108 [Mycena floridula]